MWNTEILKKDQNFLSIGTNYTIISEIMLFRNYYKTNLNL